MEFRGKTIGLTTAGGVDCVSLSDVCAVLSGRIWRVGTRMVVVLPAADSGGVGEEFVFRSDSAVVLARGRRVVMPRAPVVQDSEVMIPAVVAVELFGSGTGAGVAVFEVSAVAESLVLRLRTGEARAAESAAVWGRSVSSLEYHLTVGVGIDSASLERLRQGATAGTGLLKSVTRSGGTIVLGFRQPASTRLDRFADRVELRAWPRPQRRIGRIVLDPGHGGKDPGAVGRVKQTLEKDVVLDVAKRLRTKLEKHGYEVVMTRDSDTYVSLFERSKVASRTRADLFVSIHANASPNRAACGLETYFLSEAKTDWERAVAARENAEMDSLPDGMSYGPGDLGLILADLAQSEFLHESSDLAGRIQELTFPHARVMDRGVRQANFYVLRNNYMPAVLVEVGFLSNKSEENLLRQPGHREKLSEGVFQGIVDFCRQYEARVNGNGGKPGTAKK